LYKQYSFPYRPVHRRLSPMVPVRLFYNKSRIRTYAYPDSGAYYSVFHRSEARDLGIEITTGKRERLTMADGRLITIYLHHVGFRLGEEHFTATIGFSEELGIGLNLLGRYSIFDKLMFCFNDYEHMLYVSRIE